MKQLMISSALVAFTATASFADNAMFRAEADPMDVAVSQFIGQRVYSSDTAVAESGAEGAQQDWQDIGEINDVIVSRDGAVEAVLVDIGGFLGLGERQVAVDMSALKFVPDTATADDDSDYFLVMTAARSSFEQAPAYSWGAAAQHKMEEAAKSVRDAAAATATAVSTAANDAADTLRGQPMLVEGYQAVGVGDLSTEMLVGAKAYDTNDAHIGEVSGLIVNDQGVISHAIVDVGGFLGLGEKPVELALADLDILKETDGDDLRVYIGKSRAELDAMPRYTK
ncbi:MAG: PRC-barrel domain-containing protein [Paracoccaceae bacterium]|nr:PRC-barrel domain-containing protein [Paracoccaceae bacterium]